MRASDYLKSRFFTADDFSDRPETYTIVSVGEEVIGRDSPTTKPVLELADGDGKAVARLLSLNKTNLRVLAKVYGDDMKSSVGRPIRIRSDWTSFKGERTRGIQVAPGAVTVRTAGGGQSLNDEIPF